MRIQFDGASFSRVFAQLDHEIRTAADAALRAEADMIAYSANHQRYVVYGEAHFPSNLDALPMRQRRDGVWVLRRVKDADV